ncbi:TonB-dependent receptor plug domain-containing protein [Dissulfurispira sp.]|uniref:TonB-dependent receptor plug domain-containing protein n=1 Tax=Dissulfurispira sp. TaxID=2817609 RepID=UPI002FD9DB3D
MEKVLRGFLFCILILLIGIRVVKAEEKEAKFEEIVVTATKTQHTLEDVPVETVLITKEEIEQSNAKNVSETLRKVHGFYIQGENVPGSSAWRSKLRGLDFDKGYGLVLINGERVLGGAMGEYGISLNQIPVEMIEKIEIVKGTASVLYGSDAMAGVVNIITKPIPEKPLFTASAGYGSYDTSLLNLGYGQWFNDKFGFFVSAHRETSERGRYGAAEDDFKGEYVSTRLAYRLSPKTVLNLGFNHDDLRWKYMVEEKLRISPSVEINFPDDSVLKIKGYWYKLDLDSFSPGYTRRSGDIAYTQMETQYTKAIGNYHLATIGAEYLRRDVDLMSGAQKIDKQLEVKSLYLQDEIVLKPLSIVIGGRLDDNSLYGTEFNPKASLMWNISDDTRMRLSAGRAFKSPTIRQLYVNFKHGTWWNIPNENLNPEISWGYSVGIEHTFSKRLSTNLSAFRNDIKNIIVPVDISATERTWKNAQKAYTQGVEAGVKASVLDNLAFNLGYTYLETKNKNTEKRLSYNPNHTASLGIDYKIKPLKMSLHWFANYISEAYKNEANTQKTNDYYISNLKVVKEITKNLKFSLDIDNIFESDYGEPDKQWLGRVIFGKLTFNI